LKGTAVAAFLAAWAAAALVAFACIPDLPPADASPASDASFGADTDADADAQPPPPPAQPFCGDGIVELDRGEQCDPGLGPDAGNTVCSSTCLMICPGPDAGGFVWSQNNHCYSYDGTTASGLDDEATAHCQAVASGTHVVTFASEEEFQAVVGALHPAGPFWVGLDPFSVPNEYTALALYEPGWAPTCPGCFAHTDASTSPLPGTTASCVEALADAEAPWQQYPCSAAPKIGVVCEREPVGFQSERCDAGTCIDVPYTHPQKRYVFSSTKMGGDIAEGQCEALGGTLVVLESRDEREQIWYALKEMGGTPGSFWIGFAEQNGVWTWANDAAADAYPSPWGNKQPTGNGSRAYLVQSLTPPVLFDTTLAHNDENVLTPIDFVCQVPATDGGF
jgi:hypothetical protein